MSINSVHPADIIADGMDSTEINGRTVRKGTIGAFLANAELFEDCNANEEQKQVALAAIIELAPAVIAIGLHKHVVFKNAQVEQILINAASTPC